MKHDASTWDPVCDMAVSPDSHIKFIYREHDYRFCSEACREKFKNDPAAYVTIDGHAQVRDHTGSRKNAAHNANPTRRVLAEFISCFS